MTLEYFPGKILTNKDYISVEDVTIHRRHICGNSGGIIVSIM